MRLKPILLTFFILMGLYFLGMGVLSLGDTPTSVGFGIIGLVHILIALGIFFGKELSLQAGTYITLLDLIFGIIWVIVSFEPASASLTFLAAITLVIITSDEARREILY
ncbi:hypothetical protein PAP_05905 [Palaeococcus pacificus DY20341]|uniref:Uncharacterized protein n=1 Tax=Palaeococcus pacificus DY20341 TaxID=1343739 RepID=A0A075LU02_9EURY|nr:hypothetical protein [Palaeococcus pacificus]AIF69581.1 hypothetical protein PAP_05905 [Palaeococcus pacificus DY20341]